MRKLSLFIFLISMTVILNAQTQITSSDIANVLAQDKEWLVVSNDNVQTTMNIGSAGGSSQNWTIPSINFTDTITAVNISLSSWSYLSNFPEATHCQQLNNRVLSLNYYKLDNSALYSLGFVHDTTLVVVIGNRIVIIDTVILLKNTTSLFSLPVTYGTTEQTVDTTDDGLGNISIETRTQSVDAFGNFAFPFGTYSALRMSEDTKTQNYVNGILINEDDQLSISWITTAGFFQVDVIPSTGNSGTVNITSASLTKFTDAPTALNDAESNIPSSFSLYQNYPNPFNPTTKITYSIIKAGKVSLEVFDMLGREVTTLVNEQKPTGIYEVIFDATSLPSGVYFYQLKADSFTKTRKMILLL